MSQGSPIALACSILTGVSLEFLFLTCFDSRYMCSTRLVRANKNMQTCSDCGNDLPIILYGAKADFFFANARVWVHRLELRILTFDVLRDVAW